MENYLWDTRVGSNDSSQEYRLELRVAYTMMGEKTVYTLYDFILFYFLCLKGILNTRKPDSVSDILAREQ